MKRVISHKVSLNYLHDCLTKMLLYGLGNPFFAQYELYTNVALNYPKI